MVGLGRYLTNYDTIIHGFTEHRGGEHHIFKEQLASSTAGCKMGRPGLQRCWKSSCGGGELTWDLSCSRTAAKGDGFLSRGIVTVGFCCHVCSLKTNPRWGGGEQTQCRRDLSHGPAAAGQGSTITLHPTHFEDVSSALVAQILNSGR